MTYRVILTKKFIQDSKKLDSLIVRRIRKKFEEISENPERYKHMKYDFSGNCRIWIGKWRIIFSYNIEAKEIYLQRVVFGHKY
jgi:mRNA-degrading endonuclease RelE of RelBE toxin-antitoxin system